MKRTILVFALLLGLAISSCSNEGDSQSQSITNATIIIYDASGALAPGITVYAYDKEAWDLSGDNTFYANGQAVSDANGIVLFSNIEYLNTFNALNNNQNTFHFSAHYSVGGVSKTKVLTQVFIKSQQRTLPLTLN